MFEEYDRNKLEETRSAMLTICDALTKEFEERQIDVKGFFQLFCDSERGIEGCRLCTHTTRRTMQKGKKTPLDFYIWVYRQYFSFYVVYGDKPMENGSFKKVDERKTLWGTEDVGCLKNCIEDILRDHFKIEHKGR